MKSKQDFALGRIACSVGRIAGLMYGEWERIRAVCAISSAVFLLLSAVDWLILTLLVVFLVVSGGLLTRSYGRGSFEPGPPLLPFFFGAERLAGFFFRRIFAFLGRKLGTSFSIRESEFSWSWSGSLSCDALACVRADIAATVADRAAPAAAAYASMHAIIAL